MKDRYLFRGKRVDNGEWVTGSLIYHDNIVDIHCESAQVGVCKSAPFYAIIPETVGQCTGKKVKDTLVFENDTLKIKRLDEPKMISEGIVLWDGYSWQVELEDGSNVSLGYLFINIKNYDIEIIGTIHDEVQS